MKTRSAIVSLILILVVVSVGLTVALTGSGTIGQVQPGWSVVEECTPVAPGDTKGAVGNASVSAAATSTSRYILDNPADLTTSAGTFHGRVRSATVHGEAVSFDVTGGLGFLVADRTMPPVWYDDTLGLSFLTYGSSAGQVGTPGNIAVDPADGSIYVTSVGMVGTADRYKVIKFSAAGTYLLEWGSVGSGNGQFGAGLGGPDIAISPVDGSVYVSDYVNSRIQKFTSAGVYSTQWGTAGTGNGQFGTPTSPINIAVDSTGAVYAADRPNLRIQKFTSAGTYSSQVAYTGYSTQENVTTLRIGPSDVLYASVLMRTALSTEPLGVIRSYNTSLSLLGTLTPVAPTGTVGGAYKIGVDAAGIWVHWGGATYLVKYDFAGNEITRWVSSFPALNGGFSINTTLAGDAVVLFRPVSGSTATLTGNYVVGFHYVPVALSQVFERYMEACDSTLGGYLFDYQATDDPAVVFPGWQGNVWAQLKNLCTSFGVELSLVGNTIVVRDIGDSIASVSNRTPVTITPSNVAGGRRVDILVQNPVAGGGVMWDAATEGRRITIRENETAYLTITTTNSPVSVSPMTQAATLPALPGQYYVVDSSGNVVNPASWAAGGGFVNVELTGVPGEIRITLRGPSAISGQPGPFAFMTGSSAAGVPAFSITGPGVITTPKILELMTGADETVTTQEVAVTVQHPFIDTLERAYDRGDWATDQAGGSTVTIMFTVSEDELDGIGLTPGALFTHQACIYRITDVTWGLVGAQITATRHTTLGDVDTAWAGQTLGTSDAFWSGYTLGDRNLQPLLTTR